MVLYYAQILPIALVEAAPLGINLLSLCVAYLYGITCLGVWQTAAYFHTPGEVWMGLLVAQLIHAPLVYLHSWSDGPWRRFFFGSPNKRVR